jgi:hypothetical protein
VPGTQEVSKAAGGHDIGRARTQFILEIEYFIDSSQSLMSYFENLTKDQTSTARNGVGRETGSSPAA